MLNLLTAGFRAEGEGARVDLVGSSVRLCAESKSFSQKFYGAQKVFTFILEKDIKTEEYLVLSYSAQGLRRQYVNRLPLIYGMTDEGEVPLVCFDDMILDNREHSVCVRTERAKYKGIKICYSIDRRKYAHLTVKELYLCSAAELPIACKRGSTEAVRDFKTVDLSGYFNGSFGNGNESIVDGGRFFESENISLYEIPFRVGCEGNNIIIPPPAPKENDEIIDNFGVPVQRKLCRPISRESAVEIPLSGRATEIYFILSLSGKRHQRWGFAQDGTVLGKITGEVYMPLLVADTTGFAAEVVYKDGRRDMHLPWNLSLGRHGISGDISVYGVPADGEVESLIIHNRLLDTDVSLVALTVNGTDDRLRPEMLIPEREEQIVHSVADGKGITLEGNLLTLMNGALYMQIDLSRGMRLVGMKNGFVEDLSVKSCEMLKLRTGDDYDTAFELVRAHGSDEKAEMLFKKGELYIEITAALGDDNDVKWQLTAKNRGRSSVKYGIVFPDLCGINHSDADDNWYFIPKYQNILSNETVFIYEESSPNFPMQFMDVFSPKAQGGLCLTTQERRVVTRKYGFEKNEQGMELYVEYPEMYGEIKSGEEFIGSPTVLTAHEGDWRSAFGIYKRWLDSWYEPYNCQDKDWYRRSFWLFTEYCDFVVEDKPIYKLPLWKNSEKTGELNFKEILEEQNRVAGCYPDILHLWASWTHDIVNGKSYNAWGNWGEEDYEVYGGRERLRQALHGVKDDMGINVSLYFHPTLLSTKYGHLSHYLTDHKAINDIGDTIMCGPYSYRMCHASEEWRKYAISVYPRVYKELGIPLMYIDEFSLRCENRCYADNHGHSIPSNLLKTDHDFITELKHQMPPEVVLYGEYAAVDIYAQYIDCNISYYLTDNVIDMIEFSWKGDDGDDRLSRIYPNVYKFAFPRIVQLALPSGMRHLSWHPQKFMFFNGDAVYDSMWDCEESTGNDFNIKAYKIKKEYADCFASDNPEGFVDTLSPAICANRFPAENRELYTVYNRAYSTYRGKILKVKHTDGARYYDVWNGKPLEVEIKDGYAEIYLTVDAQEMGCVLIER